MVDPIGDMLSRIRNAQAVQKAQIEVPFSRLKHEIAKILEREKFITSLELKGRKIRKDLVLGLGYQDKKPLINGLRRISRPGQRITKGASELHKVKGGLGIAIISTSKGIMTDKEARKLKVGGEVLCEIW